MRPERRLITINGKFLSHAPTGVHRVAEQLISSIDEILEDDEDIRQRLEFEIFAPKNIIRRLELKHIKIVTGGMFEWIPWEQIDFALRRPDSTHLSLCNLGPVFCRDGVVMIHDAQVHITPKSYSKAFRVYYKTIQPLIAFMSRCVLTVSNFSRLQLQDCGVAPLSKIVVVENGASHMQRIAPDASILKTLGLEIGEYVVGLANVQAHKNVAILVEAMADPRLSELKLVLFGKISDADRDLLVGAGGAPNIIFSGSVTDSELRSLMEHALALCFPSRTEGFGLPPIEAMWVGCPVIAAPCGALPEVCSDAADYASADNAEAWSDAILHLQSDPAHRQSRIDMGKARSREFQWRRSAMKLIEIL